MLILRLPRKPTNKTYLSLAMCPTKFGSRKLSKVVKRASSTGWAFEGCSVEEDKFIKGEGNLKLLLTTQDQVKTTIEVAADYGGSLDVILDDA